jgi:hypothetical protein
MNIFLFESTLIYIKVIYMWSSKAKDHKDWFYDSIFGMSE